MTTPGFFTAPKTIRQRSLLLLSLLLDYSSLEIDEFLSTWPLFKIKLQLIRLLENNMGNIQYIHQSKQQFYDELYENVCQLTEELKRSRQTIRVKTKTSPVKKSAHRSKTKMNTQQPQKTYLRIRTKDTEFVLKIDSGITVANTTRRS